MVLMWPLLVGVSSLAAWRMLSDPVLVGAVYHYTGLTYPVGFVRLGDVYSLPASSEAEQLCKSHTDEWENRCKVTHCATEPIVSVAVNISNVTFFKDQPSEADLRCASCLNVAWGLTHFCIERARKQQVAVMCSVAATDLAENEGYWIFMNVSAAVVPYFKQVTGLVLYVHRAYDVGLFTVLRVFVALACLGRGCYECVLWVKLKRRIRILNLGVEDALMHGVGENGVAVDKRVKVIRLLTDRLNFGRIILWTAAGYLAFNGWGSLLFYPFLYATLEVYDWFRRPTEFAALLEAAHDGRAAFRLRVPAYNAVPPTVELARPGLGLHGGVHPVVADALAMADAARQVVHEAKLSVDRATGEVVVDVLEGKKGKNKKRRRQVQYDTLDEYYERLLERDELDEPDRRDLSRFDIADEDLFVAWLEPALRAEYRDPKHERRVFRLSEIDHPNDIDEDEHGRRFFVKGGTRYRVVSNPTSKVEYTRPWDMGGQYDENILPGDYESKGVSLLQLRKEVQSLRDCYRSLERRLKKEGSLEAALCVPPAVAVSVAPKAEQCGAAPEALANSAVGAVKPPTLHLIERPVAVAPPLPPPAVEACVAVNPTPVATSSSAVTFKTSKIVLTGNPEDRWMAEDLAHAHDVNVDLLFNQMNKHSEKRICNWLDDSAETERLRPWTTEKFNLRHSKDGAVNMAAVYECMLRYYPAVKSTKIVSVLCESKGVGAVCALLDNPRKLCDEVAAVEKVMAEDDKERRKEAFHEECPPIRTYPGGFCFDKDRQKLCHCLSVGGGLLTTAHQMDRVAFVGPDEHNLVAMTAADRPRVIGRDLVWIPKTVVSIGNIPLKCFSVPVDGRKIGIHDSVNKKMATGALDDVVESAEGLVLRYKLSTELGTCGAPVIDEQGFIVGIHHADGEGLAVTQQFLEFFRNPRVRAAAAQLAASPETKRPISVRYEHSRPVQHQVPMARYPRGPSRGAYFTPNRFY
jgi:hypothetical protein